MTPAAAPDFYSVEGTAAAVFCPGMTMKLVLDKESAKQLDVVTTADKDSVDCQPHASHRLAHPSVQWSEDVIKADPFLGRSRVRFRVPPWASNTIARDHLA